MACWRAGAVARSVIAAAAVAAVVAVAAAAAHGALARGAAPSERGCLVAWNAPANAAARRTIAAGAPWATASLHPGSFGTFTWGNGHATHTTSAACLLTFAKRGGSATLVVGTWRGGGVRHWSLRPAASAGVGPPNVRVLPDGRVTKIYRR